MNFRRKVIKVISEVREETFHVRMKAIISKGAMKKMDEYQCIFMNVYYVYLLYAINEMCFGLEIIIKNISIF